MIEPTKVDIGRRVLYMRPNRDYGGPVEEGVITSFNDHCVFVRYGSGITSQATRREDLEWWQVTRGGRGSGTSASPDISLDDLIAWLETKPAQERYDFMSLDECLWGKYFREHGVEFFLVAGSYYRTKGWEEIPLPGCKHVDDVDGWGARVAYARTYGEALVRARRMKNGKDPDTDLPMKC